MSFEKNLRDTTRTLPQKQVSESFIARTQSALDQVDYSPHSEKAPLLPRRVLLAGLAAACVGTSLFFAPRLMMTRSYAAEMHQAMQKANTWHFYGWRLSRGKKVHWEVWGRRSPFLYREQMGEETMIDDGVRRIHILPPDGSIGQTHGSYLITPSEPLVDARQPTRTPQTLGSAGLLAGIGGDPEALDCQDKGSFYTCTGWMKVFRHDEIEEDTTTLTVNKQTNLPTRYVVERQTFQPGPTQKEDGGWEHRIPTGNYTQAELIPVYNQPLPEDVTRIPPSPAGYTVTNALVAINGDSQDGLICTRSGMTLKAQVIGQDKEGNLRVRFEGWLGSEPIQYKRQNLSLMIQSAIEGIVTQGSPANQDDTGNAYVDISLPPGQSMDAEHPEWWLVPAEPLTEKNAAPQTIRLTVRANLNKYERQGNSGRTVAILQDTFTFTLPLPAKKAPLGWDSIPNGVKLAGFRPTLRLESAAKRGFYYFRSALPATDHKIASLDRATYWFNAAVDEGTRTQNHMMVNISQKNLTEVARLKDSLQAQGINTHTR